MYYKIQNSFEEKIKWEKKILERFKFFDSLI